MSSKTIQQYPSQFFSRCLQLACILFAPALAIPAGAATEKANSPIEEIVVTAAKREQYIKDFSGSISVIKTDSLNPGASLSDIANQAPGLSVINNGPRNGAAITLRGLRMDTVTSKDTAGDGSTVTSYVDNIPLQGFYMPPSFSLKDLQQVEVLRGPQGTLYGHASVGGLIRYITAKPDLSKSTFSLTTGTSHTKQSQGLNYDADFVANMPMIENQLGARVLLARQENQGFIDNDELLTGKKKDVNSDQAEQVRTIVLWQPNTEFSLSGSYEYQKNEAEDRQASNAAFTGDEYKASSRYAQPLHGVLRLASVDATYEFDWASVTASVNQSDYKAHSQADQTDYILTVFGAGYYEEYDQFSAFTKTDVDVVRDSSEIRFVSPSDQPLRWLAGGFYSQDNLDVVIADRVPGFASQFNEVRPDDLDYYATQKAKLSEQSYYTDVAYDLTAQWEISLGARHFRAKDDSVICSLLFPTSTSYEGNNYPVDCLSGHDIQAGSLGKLSSKYKITNKHVVYFAVTEGFRRGGANFLPVEVKANRSYKADTNINYEIGTHSDFLQDNIKLNAAIFYTDWKDVQIQTKNAEFFDIVGNAGAARSRGFEMDGVVQLLPELSASLGYAFVDTEISETINNMDGSDGNALVGDRLPGSPREQLNLGLSYKRTVNVAMWSAAIHYAYNTSTTTALNSSFVDYARLDGYGMINTNIGVSLRNWRFSCYVNNLANTRAITHKRLPRLYGEQGQFEYITRPRTIGVSANYQF